MSFLSPNFGPFLLLSVVGFHWAPRGWRPAFLLAASLSFYAVWSIPHTVLLLGTTGAVYLAARWVGDHATGRRPVALTVVALTGLLLLLTVFKCGQSVAAHLLEPMGPGKLDPGFLLVVPMGLSYYLFKLMGYLLDVYWEKIPARRDFASLALYASFFPQMNSGPIQRADDFFHQLEHLALPAALEVVTALRRILFGLFKKVVVADQLSRLVDRVFANPDQFSPLELLLAAYCFAFQIYADFSGVTDIAIGSGQLCGINGPENFNFPYWAKNLQEFWRRWHMSLTTWLADYLFTPLRMAFRKLGNVGLALAIFINMFAVGVWHGPTWTYAAFGGLHGIFMIVSALTLKKRNSYFRRHDTLAKLRRFAGPFCTFHLVVFGLIVFRSTSVEEAVSYIVHLIGMGGDATPAGRLQWSLLGLSINRFVVALAGLGALEALDWQARNGGGCGWLTLAPRTVRWTGYYAMIILIVFLATSGTQGFIYGHF
jgi:D-alanyl-lipoteichoic acid acyltransferase DltB (MBOAT superfamily)